MEFRDREHFLEELQKNIDEALEKAKFISPEQQKANQLKAKQVGNDVAFDAARIKKPKEKKPEDKSKDKKPSHLSLVKAELQKCLELWAQEILEKGDKPSKADIWKQTVAFLAPHSKGYAAIHAKNVAKDKKPEDVKPKAAPAKAGEKGESARVKGEIRPESVSFPMKDEKGKDTGKFGKKTINVQDTHHWVHNGKEWKYSHTTSSGEGLNKR